MAQQQPITTPIALSCTNSATITFPWHVQKTEYNPAQATYQPLVNGEEAFGQIYDAILNAKQSVDIICWGFQPSMYFKRGSSNDTMPIGMLLAEKAALKGFKVRLLCWMDDMHFAELSENNMPGNSPALTWLKSKIPDSWLANSTLISKDYQKDFQRDFDYAWYGIANLNNVTKDTFLIGSKSGAIPNLEFATRDFGPIDRFEIAWREWLHSKDIGRSTLGKTKNSASFASEPTHHQKMVLIDYEMPDEAFGFVMGHNMLDTYWDRDRHSYIRYDPRIGRNGLHPRQDISSRVSGPILYYLNQNFCQAWDDATGQKLTQERAGFGKPDNKDKQFKLRCDLGMPVMAQIVRTQSQKGKQDIATMYLQAVNNTTKFIYIENQYFRYEPLAEKIKAVAQTLMTHGRDDPIYLFVVTNSNDEGIGVGTVNTYRMLDALGQANTIPGVATLEQEDARQADLQQQYDAANHAEIVANEDINDSGGLLDQDQVIASARQRVKQAQTQKAKIKAEMKKSAQPPMSRDYPGLKVHVCTLVAPDSPADKWDYVYIHAKLMIVDDVFTTQGSANINIRSMEVDSELNIAHEHSGVTAPLRRRLCDLHTGGKGAQDDPADAFDSWGKIIKRNALNQSTGLPPYASLIGFMRTSNVRSYAD